MRKRISRTHDVAVVSQPNGPVIRKRINAYPYAGAPHKVPMEYKAVKPYTRWDLMDAQPSCKKFRLKDGSYRYIDPPPVDEIFSKLGDPNEIDSVFSHLREIAYAQNYSIEHSLAYGDLLLLVTAVEAKETVQMIRFVFVRLFTSLLKVYKHAKRLNLKATFDDLADIWLEYRYGWRPLIGELTTLHDWFTSEPGGRVMSSHGNAISKDAVTHSFEDILVRSNGCSFVFDINCTFQKPTIKTGFTMVNRENSRNDSMLAQLGLDVESLLSTAWELIPFSFVVDMFLNIGTLLSTNTFVNQVESFNYFRTFVSAGEFDISCKEIVLGNTSIPFKDPGLDKDTKEVIARTSRYHRDNFYRTLNMLKQEPKTHVESLFSTKYGIVPYGYLKKDDHYGVELRKGSIWVGPDGPLPWARLVPAFQPTYNPHTGGKYDAAYDEYIHFLKERAIDVTSFVRPIVNEVTRKAALARSETEHEHKVLGMYKEDGYLGRAYYRVLDRRLLEAYGGFDRMGGWWRNSRVSLCSDIDAYGNRVTWYNGEGITFISWMNNPIIPNQPFVDPEALKYHGSMNLMNRSEIQPYYDAEFTADSELGLDQWVDLAALAPKLIQRFT